MPELADEPLHGGVRAAVAALGDEPVVDPPGGAALLPRGPEVGLENARDPFLVALERGPAPPPGHRRGGRHVLHVGVLRHGVPAHVEHSGDLGPRAPGGIYRPYIIHCVQGHGHLLHPSRAGSPKCPLGETVWRGGRASGSRGTDLLLKLLSFSAHGARLLAITRTSFSDH